MLLQITPRNLHESHSSIGVWRTSILVRGKLLRFGVVDGTQLMGNVTWCTLHVPIDSVVASCREPCLKIPDAVDRT